VNAPARLAVFAVGLAAVFGAAVGVGSAVGPVGPAPAAPMADGGHGGDGLGGDGGHDETAADLPAGLMVAEDGYTLALAAPSAPAGPGTPIAFSIDGRDGAPVTAFDENHEERLHLIAVRRDLTGFQHVHPTLGGDGVWRTTLDLTPGSWRLFADFVASADGERRTLGTDLGVPGGYSPAPLPEAAGTAVVDGYSVTLTGGLTAGEESALTLTVTRDGHPVTDLQPYLGAYGHLVALRSGDLAYLHVHPGGEPDDGKTEPGPEIAFDAEVPSTGVYHLYLDFKHGDVVRTAQFRLETTPTSSTAGHTGSEGHGDH
jgi:hypothetical protein